VSARFAAGVALGVATVLAGCGSLQPVTPTVVTAARSGGPVTLQTGDTLVVALDAQPSTGYRWETLDLQGPVLVAVGSADYLPSTVAPGTVGAPGDSVFRYQARDVGHTTLDLGYSRPFENGVAPARTVHYDVTVVARSPSWLAVWSKSQ
jgi:inhibitor of cysteine peptidase